MEIKEPIASFKVSELANKKGFYIIQEYGLESSLYSYTGDHIYYTNYGVFDSSLYAGFISAPTLTLLQKWLREVHKLDVIIINDGGAEFYGYRAILVDKNKKPINNNAGFLCYPTEDIGMLTTYEETLELGIIEALEKIPDA